MKSAQGCQWPGCRAPTVMAHPVHSDVFDTVQAQSLAQVRTEVISLSSGERKKLAEPQLSELSTATHTHPHTHRRTPNAHTHTSWWQLSWKSSMGHFPLTTGKTGYCPSWSRPALQRLPHGARRDVVERRQHPDVRLQNPVRTPRLPGPLQGHHAAATGLCNLYCNSQLKGLEFKSVGKQIRLFKVFCACWMDNFLFCAEL